ncbi:MAG: glycosyl hydrolase family 28 protein [Thermoguttaceae bacterium]|nr:glycosyl hydrolase family 28 protein [Thermoguttaceae bacterium]
MKMTKTGRAVKLLVLLVLVATNCWFCNPIYSDHERKSYEFNITEYGAIGDGKTLNTKAIQQTLDACAKNGGGTVVIPPGTFVSGTIFLKNNTELRLAPGAILKASTHRDDYCKLDAYPQNFEALNEGWGASHLIVGVNVKKVSITGEGTIDGSADAFLGDPVPAPQGATDWRFGFSFTKGLVPNKVPETMRHLLRPGQLIVFCESESVRIRNISVRNIPSWGCYLYGCNDVFVTGLKVDNPPTIANSDGLDIDSCRNVVVSDCRIITADDAIAVRGAPSHLLNKDRACEHIVITNCVLSSSSSVFRIGVGNGAIRDVNISNIIILTGGNGFHFQSSYSQKDIRGVNISRVRCSNINMRKVSYPIRIQPGTKSASAAMDDIVFDGIYAEYYLGVVVTGNENTAPKRITIRNSEFVAIDNPIRMRRFPESYFKVSDGATVRFENVSLRWDNVKHWKNAFDFATAASVKTFHCDWPEPTQESTRE